MRIITAAFAALLLFTIAALADPVGKYQVEGANPSNGKPYSGTVTVTKTGQTYRVVWVIGGTRYVGTGIGNKDFMAVSYTAGSSTGLALYAPSGEDWIGAWTYSGGTQIGAERWSRQ